MSSYYVCRAGAQLTRIPGLAHFSNFEDENMKRRATPSYTSNEIKDILFCISEELGAKDIAGLKYLLFGLVKKSHLEKNILEIFEHLRNVKIISESEPWFILGCLEILHREDLIRKYFSKLKCHRAQITPTSHISKYRITLYEVGMDLDENWKLLGFLLEIAKGKQESFTSAFELLRYLEESGIINEDDTRALQTKLKDIGRADLAEKLMMLETCRPDPLADCDQMTQDGIDGPAEFRLTKSVIKGFHSFKKIPPKTQPPTRLPVTPEEKSSCVIRLPEVTHYCRSEGSRFYLHPDITDSIIGRAPSCLCLIFQNLIKDGCQIFAEPTGAPCLSFPPWPKPYERGGGAVIPCNYIITSTTSEILRRARETCKTLLESEEVKDLDMGIV